MRKALSCLLALILLASCAPYVQEAGTAPQVPDIVDEHYIADDGIRLPLRVWMPKTEPKAVILGVHGFNDYGNFLMPGMPAFLQKNGIILITYDQRGFGATPQKGIWAGTDRLTNDLAQMIHLVKSRYESLPLYVMGESMGGAIVINTLSHVRPLPVEGAILSAPAVWGISTWPWYQKTAFYFFSYTMPWLKLSGGGVVQPTDAIDTWRNWSLDPLVIRETRVDSIFGVSQAMEGALQSADKMDMPLLMLYGAKDEVIPAKPTAQFVQNLPQGYQLALYENGWHWLPRDKNGPRVWRDILSWIADKEAPLPSGEDKGALEKMLKLQ